MSSTLNAYRSINDLTYSELPPPDYGELVALDNDEIKKENALEFYRFELSLLQMTGVQDQLEIRVANQEKLMEDGQQIDQQDDPGWTQIQNGMKSEVAEIGFKMHAMQTTDIIDKHEAIDQYAAKASQYTHSIAKNGVVDRFFQYVLPSTVAEWISGVARRTVLNMQIVGWSRPSLSPSSEAQAGAVGESIEETASADALYHILSPRLKSMNSNSSYLRLPERNGSKPAFQMFLSCSSKDKWQRATCRFESADSTPHDQRLQKDVCTMISDAYTRQAHLLLSYNTKKIWMSKQAVGLLYAHEKEPQFIELEKVITDGNLKTDDHDLYIKKFRLALRLVSSLRLLVLGPWIQHEWNPKNIFIAHRNDKNIVDMLEEAYISCDFAADWKNTFFPIKLPEEANTSEVCPKLFLSLSQLLIDLVNGKKGQRPSNPDDFNSWYTLMVNQVTENLDNALTGDYWKAIQGCLLYFSNYDWQSQDLPERLRAQAAIESCIIRHLRNNLRFWEEQRVDIIDNAPSHGNVVRRYENAQAHKDVRHLVSNSRTQFTLWSEEENESIRIENLANQTREDGFVTRMDDFLDTYINVSLDSADEAGAARRVCVAIIDTGLYIEEGDLYEKYDPFLSHSDIAQRIVARKNFYSSDDKEPDANDHEDQHGHGTHVARLVLRFAPRADIIVAKISNSRTLNTTKTKHLIEALKWAGEKADIINLSFSLGSMPEKRLDDVIKDLVSKNKLIFAAASNTGGFGTRMWPATAPGVFAIHATDSFSALPTDINPPAVQDKDNFATFGCGVISHWNGQYVSISGTSFATPTAAAIAANILDYARRTETEVVVKRLTCYLAMRILFRDHMSPSKSNGIYHCFHPWIPGLWDGSAEAKSKIQDVLWKIAILGSHHAHV